MAPLKPEQVEPYWTKEARKRLEGRTIKSVSYMTEEEAAKSGWTKRAVVIELDDGTIIWPSQDDEGNDAGALFGQVKGKDFILPVL